MLHRVGLKERVEHDASELSGGETQRVAVAVVALVTDPALVLADEPTGNLDTRSGHEILDLFHQIHDDGRTIVMITHDPGIAAVADRRLLLDGGRLGAGVNR